MLAVTRPSPANTKLKRSINQLIVPLQSQTTTTIQEGLLAGTVPMGID